MGCGLSGFVQVGGEEREREEKQEKKISTSPTARPGEEE